MLINIKNFNKYQRIILFDRFVLLRLRKWSLQFAGILDLKSKYVFNYMNIIKSILIKNNFTKSKILCLGMGLGMTSYLGLKLKVSYVEPSKEIIKIASSFSHFDRIYNMTAQKYLDLEDSNKFDVVFYDIFIDNKVSYDALKLSKIKNHLNNKGLLIINAVDNTKGINKYIKVEKELIYSFRWIPFFKQNIIVVIKKEDLS